MIQTYKSKHDPYLKVSILSHTSNPQTLVWQSMHTCYSENLVAFEKVPTEADSGERIIRHLLAGNRGHFGCYRDDTEVFTSDGWKLWKDVDASTLLAAVDPSDHSFTFELPSALQKHWVEAEELVTVEGSKVSYSVTKDHRMYVANRQGVYSVKPALDTLEQRVKRYRLTAEYKGNEGIGSLFGIGSEDFSKLTGFFIGDGCAESSNCIRFNLRLPHKKEYLSRLGGTIRDNTASSLVISGLGQWFRGNCYVGLEKRIPDIFYSATKEELNGLFDGLKHSDGTKVNKKGGFTYTTTSTYLANQLEYFGVLAGYKVTIQKPYSTGNANHKPATTLHFSKEHTTVLDTRLPYTESLDMYTGYVYCATVSTGLLLVRRQGKQMVCGNCLEHPAITFNIGYAPHSMWQQLRTHRVGVTFDIQSMRYTSKRFLEYASEWAVYDIDRLQSLVYLRPVGYYTDRQGGKYYYSPNDRDLDLRWAHQSVLRYADKVKQGVSEEHARGLLPFDYRQHGVMSCNLRSLMHLLDLRAKLDAQIEIQWTMDLLMEAFKDWCPEVAAWYEKNRLGKARLAP